METSRQLALAFQAAPVPIVVASAEGRILQTNSALNELFEYGEGDLINEAVEILVPENLRHGHVELRNAYMEIPCNRRLGTDGQLFGVTRHGRLIPLEVGLNHVEVDGQRYVIAALHDVTDKKNEELKFRLAIDSAASSMIMAEPDGTIVFANRHACKTFGYALYEFVGLNVDRLVPEDARRKHSVYRTSFMASPASRSMGANRKLMGVRKDGSQFPVEITLTPIRNDGVRFIMATVIDVTHRNAASELEDAPATAVAVAHS